MKEDISYSEGYTEIIPYREYDLYDVAWHDSMIAGNGHIGVIESCAPLNDNLIYQNVEFVMPSDEPRYVPEEVTSQLEEAIAQLDCEDGIVFLTDLLGGTPFRVASTLAMQKPGCEVITGTNLQLLLEMVLEREGLSGEEFRVQALECGHRGLTSLVDELGRCHEECPVEEGI